MERMRFSPDPAVRNATNALSFLIATHFIEPDDDFIDSVEVSDSEKWTATPRRLACIITARRLVVIDMADASPRPTPRRSIPYCEISEPPTLRWRWRALLRAFGEDRDIVIVARSVELVTTNEPVTLFGTSPAVVAIRDAVLQAQAAGDGRASPSRRQRRKLEEMLPYIDISPEEILRNRSD